MRFTTHDLTRIIEKLRQVRAQGAQQKPAGLLGVQPHVHAPLHWPGFGNRIERAANEWILSRALRSILPGDPAPHAVITTLPITADLARRTADLNWVYYCVDDLAEWPGLDREALATMERQQVAIARTIIVASEALRERMRRLGRESHLLTHGVDLEHWRGVEPRGGCTGAIDGRVLVALFWGYADRRLDVDICLEIAKHCELRIVGPVGEVDVRMKSHPRITWRGPVPYHQLRDEAQQADVLVMPYADLPVTRAMQPLKLKEYLATNMPVVATPLPANIPWSDALELVATPEAFATACVHCAKVGVSPLQAVARQRLTKESWAAKAHTFVQLLHSAP
jgi:hypothetical protein